MNQTLIASAITAVFVSAAGTAFAANNARHTSAHNASAPTHAVAQPAGGPALLYDQFTNATGNGFVIDDSASSSDSYDAEGADDFVVPAGGWSVEQFNFEGFATSGGARWTATSNVYVYPDAAGQPGPTPTCSYPGNASSYDAGTQIVSVTLATPCVLTPGTYWVGLQAVNDYSVTNDQHYWSQSSPVANSVALWRNPGDAFGSGCTSFTAVTTCGGTDPDFAFQVLGSVSTPVDLQSFSID